MQPVAPVIPLQRPARPARDGTLRRRERRRGRPGDPHPRRLVGGPRASQGAARGGAAVHRPPATPADAVARGRGIRRCSSCSRRWRWPTARSSPSSGSASSARQQLDAAAVEAALSERARHAAAARRRERGQGRAGDLPARADVLARGATAARAGRADRRADCRSASSRRGRGTRSSMPPASSCRRPRRPAAGRPLLTVSGGTDSRGLRGDRAGDALTARLDPRPGHRDLGHAPPTTSR